jgi:hypothetical protein
MISACDLRNRVIIPVLDHLELDATSAQSLSAQNLLLGTAAAESELGLYLCQLGGGPALGPWQMEPATHDDVFNHWLVHRPLLRAKLTDFMISCTPAYLQLAGNLYYGAALCRLQYRRHAMPLPSADDLRGLARMWKVVWNTSRGRGRESDFIEKYERLVGPA